MPPPRTTIDDLAAKEHQLRVNARTRHLKGEAKGKYHPTPLQAWRQAADDVRYNRPIKIPLVKLRTAKPDETFPEFSYADCMLSEYESRLISNSLKMALLLPVYRTPLRVLDLRNCDIDYSKAYYIGRGLAGNNSIEHLNLRNNPLSSEGVAEIMKGLLASIRLLDDDNYDESNSPRKNKKFDPFGRPIKTTTIITKSSNNILSPTYNSHSSSNNNTSNDNYTNETTILNNNGGENTSMLSTIPSVHTVPPTNDPLTRTRIPSNTFSSPFETSSHETPHLNIRINNTNDDNNDNALAKANNKRNETLSPYLMIRAHKLVEIGIPPATPSTPHGLLPHQYTKQQQELYAQGLNQQSIPQQRGLTAGDMGFGTLDNNNNNTFHHHNSNSNDNNNNYIPIIITNNNTHHNPSSFSIPTTGTQRQTLPPNTSSSASSTSGSKMTNIGLTRADIMKARLATGLTTKELVGAGGITPESSISTLPDPTELSSVQPSSGSHRQRRPLGDLQQLHGLPDELPITSPYRYTTEGQIEHREEQEQQHYDTNNQLLQSSMDGDQFYSSDESLLHDEGSYPRGDGNGDNNIPYQSSSSSSSSPNNLQEGPTVDNQGYYYLPEPTTSTLAHLPSERRVPGLREALQRHRTEQIHPGTVDGHADFLTPQQLQLDNRHEELEKKAQELSNPITEELKMLPVALGGENQHKNITDDNPNNSKNYSVTEIHRIPPEEVPKQYEPYTYTTAHRQGLAGPPIDRITGKVLKHPLKYLNLANTLLGIPEKQAAANLDIRRVEAKDSKGCDQLGEFLSHPSCGIQNLNISKNRLEPEACEKLWACLDTNSSLEIVGLHSTNAGPVVAAAFISKATGLSLSHGRAALMDERLGIFGKAPDVSTLLVNTTLGYLQGNSMGTGGQWLLKKKSSPNKKILTVKKSSPTHRLQNLDTAGSLDSLRNQPPHMNSMILSEHSYSSYVQDEHDADNENDDATNYRKNEEEEITETQKVFQEARILFERFLPISMVDSISFRERVQGLKKINLSYTNLGNVGALALATIFLAANRADEVERGTLRLQRRQAVEIARKLRNLAIPMNPFTPSPVGRSTVTMTNLVKSSRSTSGGGNNNNLLSSRFSALSSNSFGTNTIMQSPVGSALSVIKARQTMNTLVVSSSNDLNTSTENAPNSTSVIRSNLTVDTSLSSQHQHLLPSSDAATNTSTGLQQSLRMDDFNSSVQYSSQPNDSIMNNASINSVALIPYNTDMVSPSSSSSFLLSSTTKNNLSESPLLMRSPHKPLSFPSETVYDIHSTLVVNPSTFAAASNNFSNTIVNVSGPLGTSGVAPLTNTTAPGSTLKSIGGLGPITATIDNDNDALSRVALQRKVELTSPDKFEAKPRHYSSTRDIPKKSPGSKPPKPSEVMAQFRAGEISNPVTPGTADRNRKPKSRSGSKSSVRKVKSFLTVDEIAKYTEEKPRLSLEYLKLRGNQIGPIAIRALCRGLRLTQTLVRLDLSNNPLGSIGAHILAETFKYPHFAISEISLNDCYLTDSGKDFSGVHALLEALTTNRTLIKLYLRGNTLVAQDFKFKTVAKTQEITYSLSRILAENRTLYIMDLRDNYIKEAGQRAIEQALEKYPYVVPYATEIAALVTLWLDRNLQRHYIRQSITKPTVNELLIRPPSSAPIGSVYATLEGDAGRIVKEAEQRNLEQDPLWRIKEEKRLAKLTNDSANEDTATDTTFSSRTTRPTTRSSLKRGGGGGSAKETTITSSMMVNEQGLTPGDILRAVHITTDMIHGKILGSNNNSTSTNGTNGSSHPLSNQSKEEKEAFILAEIAKKQNQMAQKNSSNNNGKNNTNTGMDAGTGGKELDQSTKNILALSSLLAATKNGTGATNQALAFLATVVPMYEKAPTSTTGTITSPSNANATVRPRAVTPSATSTTKAATGTSATTNASVTNSRANSASGNSRVSSAMGRRQRRLSMLQSTLTLPRVILRGQKDIDGHALQRWYKQQLLNSKLSSNRLQNSMNNTGTTGLTNTVVETNRTGTTTTASNLSRPTTGHTVLNISNAAAASLDGMVTDNNNNNTTMTTTKQESIASTPTLTNSNVDPKTLVADQDYVLVRGNKFTGEVALPKLDFTRINQYGGIAPQNAFFTGQNGDDDVFLYHVHRYLNLGITPPIKLLPPYSDMIKKENTVTMNEDSTNTATETTTTGNENNNNSLSATNTTENRTEMTGKKPKKHFIYERQSSSAKNLTSSSTATDNNDDTNSSLTGAGLVVNMMEAPRGNLRRQASLREMHAITDADKNPNSTVNSGDHTNGEVQLNFGSENGGKGSSTVNGTDTVNKANMSRASKKAAARESQRQLKQINRSNRLHLDITPSTKVNYSTVSSPPIRIEPIETPLPSTLTLPLSSSGPNVSIGQLSNSAVKEKDDNSNSTAIASTGSRIRDAALGISSVSSPVARLETHTEEDNDHSENSSSSDNDSEKDQRNVIKNDRKSNNNNNNTKEGITTNRYSSLQAAALGLPSSVSTGNGKSSTTLTAPPVGAATATVTADLPSSSRFIANNVEENDTPSAIAVVPGIVDNSINNVNASKPPLPTNPNPMVPNYSSTTSDNEGTFHTASEGTLSSRYNTTNGLLLPNTVVFPGGDGHGSDTSLPPPLKRDQGTNIVTDDEHSSIMISDTDNSKSHRYVASQRTKISNNNNRDSSIGLSSSDTDTFSSTVSSPARGRRTTSARQRANEINDRLKERFNSMTASKPKPNVTTVDAGSVPTDTNKNEGENGNNVKNSSPPKKITVEDRIEQLISNATTTTITTVVDPSPDSTTVPPTDYHVVRIDNTKPNQWGGRIVPSKSISPVQKGNLRTALLAGYDGSTDEEDIHAVVPSLDMLGLPLTVTMTTTMIGGTSSTDDTAANIVQSSPPNNSMNHNEALGGVSSFSPDVLTNDSTSNLCTTSVDILPSEKRIQRTITDASMMNQLPISSPSSSPGQYKLALLSSSSKSLINDTELMPIDLKTSLAYHANVYSNYNNNTATSMVFSPTDTSNSTHILASPLDIPRPTILMSPMHSNDTNLLDQSIGGTSSSIISVSTTIDPYGGSNVYQANPGLYSKTDLSRSSKKMLIPPSRITVITQRRTHHLRDTVAQPVHSLVHLRKEVLSRIFDFLGEKRQVLV